MEKSDRNKSEIIKEANFGEKTEHFVNLKKY